MPEGEEEAVETVRIIPTDIWLIMDGGKIEATDNLGTAIQLLIAAYFIFNRTYPSHSACTLEF